MRNPELLPCLVFILKLHPYLLISFTKTVTFRGMWFVSKIQKFKENVSVRIGLWISRVESIIQRN